MATQLQSLRGRVSEFEEAVIEAVAEIDQTDGSRFGLQNTMDSVREKLADAYGDTLTDDVNEFLGVEEIDSDFEEDEDE